MIFLWVYIIISIVLLVPFHKLVWDAMEKDGLDGDDPLDRGLGWFVSLFLTSLWPIVTIGLIAIFLSRTLWSFIRKEKDATNSRQ